MLLFVSAPSLPAPAGEPGGGTAGEGGAARAVSFADGDVPFRLVMPARRETGGPPGPAGAARLTGGRKAGGPRPASGLTAAAYLPLATPRPSWLMLVGETGRDKADGGVERHKPRSAYSKLLLPIAVTLAVGGLTYALYTVRSR